MPQVFHLWHFFYLTIIPAPKLSRQTHRACGVGKAEQEELWGKKEVHLKLLTTGGTFLK